MTADPGYDFAWIHDPTVAAIAAPDLEEMIEERWQRDRQAWARAEASETPTLRVVDELDFGADPSEITAERIREVELEAHGYPEPEDRSLAVLSDTAEHDPVPDLLRAGRIHVLGAEEGSGKSYAAKELGIRVAIAGGDVFGTWPVRVTGPVLDLSEMHGDDDYEYEQMVLDSLEVSRDALAGRYYRQSLMTAAHGSPALMEASWRAWVTAWLRRKGARLLIVDTATGATRIDPWGEAIKVLYHELRVMLTELPELAIVLVVHLKKPQGKGARRISDVQGEWGRWCDVLVMLERDADRTKVSTHKRVRHQRHIIATRAGGLLIDPTDLTDATPTQKVPSATVLAAIEADPGITYAELAEKLEVSKATATNYVKALGDSVETLPGTARSGPGSAKRLYLLTQSPNIAQQARLGDELGDTGSSGLDSSPNAQHTRRVLGDALSDDPTPSFDEDPAELANDDDEPGYAS